VFLRLGLAIAFFAHSMQQIFGWYGGRGFKGMLANWKEKYAIPTPMGTVGMLTEFFGSFALLIGFFTRPFPWGWPFLWRWRSGTLTGNMVSFWRVAQERAAASNIVWRFLSRLWLCSSAGEMPFPLTDY
jgi:hypothetical protein